MAMSARCLRLSAGIGSVIPLCVGMLLIAPPAKAAVSAGLIALTCSWGDSTATPTAKTKTPAADTSRADTLGAHERGPVWPRDELKRVLGEETGQGKPGVKYTERKSGRVAMVCALLVPGLGQMYDEKPLKAAVAVGAETFYLGHVFMNRRYWDREKKIRDGFDVKSMDWLTHDRWVKEYWERSVDWIWWSSAVIFVIVVDSYVDAHLDDMRFRIEPRPVERGVAVSFVVPY